MSEIEKIQIYIERTKMEDNDDYGMKCGETIALAHITDERPVDAILLAFSYGRAKGYRLAKARAKK